VPWLLQRVTGVLLALWVVLHFTYWHFARGETHDLDAVGVSRTATSGGLGWWLWDMILAALCIYHGLNGIRNIVEDYSPARERIRWLEPALWAIGTLALVLVGWHLARFLQIVV
jgi:succinate dehydrogenase hydrophobic anchor subunit